MNRALWSTPPDSAPVADRRSGTVDHRVAELLRNHYAEVWRVLRRVGVAGPHIEDAAQQVFLVASGRLEDLQPGRERSFLIGTAIRVAANHRRTAAARYERADDEVGERMDPAPPADELLDEKRLRALLDRVLDAMPEDLRDVLVLFELEELSLDEIAELLEIPRGTAASRLRRAREAFDAAARRARAKHAFLEGT
ncbi:MAG TPA: sigma-70 family RNA polymerase sigma factor [Polyangiaceae bacterium]|nr:sigma-70 family RNA polymerase sigma factor [Polyangiaceae bacterium]